MNPKEYMDRCELHDHVVEALSKRPTTTSIWTVVGIFLGVFITVLVIAFNSLNAKVSAIEVSAEKIEAAVQQNTLSMTVMQEDYKNWKQSAPPYHTHHPDGRITKP